MDHAIESEDFFREISLDRVAELDDQGAIAGRQEAMRSGVHGPVTSVNSFQRLPPPADC